MKKLLLTLLFVVLSFSANAISVISDEETESWLEDVLIPIYKSANLPFKRDNIHIIKDDSLNAFVGDQNHMFIHTGTILEASNTNEIEGVLAHETGHILGGHILRLKIKIKDLQKASLASLVAAAGAAACPGDRSFAEYPRFSRNGGPTAHQPHLRCVGAASAPSFRCRAGRAAGGADPCRTARLLCGHRG